MGSIARRFGNYFGDSNNNSTQVAFELSVRFATSNGQEFLYTMKLLDLDNEILDPKTESESDCELLIPTEEWESIMKNVASLGEVLRVVCNENLHIEVHGLGGMGKVDFPPALRNEKKLIIRSPFAQEFAVKLIAPLSAVAVADHITDHSLWTLGHLDRPQS